MFKPATREKNRLRLALDGPAGSGKTYTALRFAFALAGKKGRVAVIDTEHGSASKYAGDAPDGVPFDFDTCHLRHFSPSGYAEVIKEAGRQGYDVLVIDSLSHAWVGAGGALDQVDRSNAKNSFTAWKDVTPQHRDMVESILTSPCHVIATMRSKMEYVIEKDDRGKTVIRKVGLKPVQREGLEYEFDLVADMTVDHTLQVSKSRCSAVDQKVANCPTAAFMEPVKHWLFSGSAPKEPAKVEEPAQSVPPDREKPKKGLRLGGNAQTNGELEKEIKRLFVELNWTPEKARGVLAEKGAKRVADLRPEDSRKLLHKLYQLSLEKEGKEAF